MQDSNISCLICSHQAPDSVKLLFQSLIQQDWEPGDEIVFIDNGINENRIAIVRDGLASLEDKGIRIVYAKEPKPGLTHARLKSFEVSRNSWLCLLDDDNELGVGAINILRRTIKEHDDLGGICPQICPKWELAPKNWTIILGHHLLSYNKTSLSQSSLSFGIWRGGKAGEHPPGGGMIIHRSAIDSFINLCNNVPIIRSFGRKGKQLLSCEDFILYNQLYTLKKPTAYVHNIVIYHHIPQDRVRPSYLLKLAFYAHYSFGFLGVMRHGKSAIVYSLYRHTGMLVLSIISHGRHAFSFQVLAGFCSMFVGAVTGAIKAYFNKDAIRIYIEPSND